MLDGACHGRRSHRRLDPAFDPGFALLRRDPLGRHLVLSAGLPARGEAMTSDTPGDTSVFCRIGCGPDETYTKPVQVTFTP